jgi:hypothetical protein
MPLQRWFCCVLPMALAALCRADVPRGWQWTTTFPFRGMTAVASSEQADEWPASKAIDGDTGEPEGLWQTLRDSPELAWLELRLEQPRTLAGVRIFHQQNPRYYRSVDYTIACWVDGDWKTVAEVRDNKTAGWREHPFPLVETTKVRITITKSEYGYRMGLNEVSLVVIPPASPIGSTGISEPYRCGPVADMGVIAFDAILPEGTRLDLSTRSAPDAGGQPGEWSQWSAPYATSGERITSPMGEWVQYRAIHLQSAEREPLLRWVTLGSPACIEHVDVGAIVPQPSQPIALRVRFRDPMDRSSTLTGELSLPDMQPVALEEGRWDAEGRTWRFAPLTPPPAEGAAILHLGGGKRADGLLMMDEQHQLVIGTGPILERLRSIAEWMMENEQAAIFVEGYNERTILGLYEITGEQAYLDHVRQWAHKLLDAQKPAGFWGTGYGDVYFADTGSALGLLINFYKFATPEERSRIDTALGRYLDLLLVKGDSTGKPFVHEDGSLGVGYHADKEGNIRSDLNKPYTISTALTGAEIFAAWYYMKGNERDKAIAIKACDWILDTVVGEEPPDPWAQPGQIPYYIDDWNKDRQNREWIWKRWPYDTSAYAGEGFIAAWTYIDDDEFRASLAQRVRPHIDWLLRTQNEDGSWAVKGSGDQLRSHGVVNLLLWYYENIRRDPRVADAIRRYYHLLLDGERSRYLNVPGNGIATSLAGRALVEIIKPGVDCYRWKNGGR